MLKKIITPANISNEEDTRKEYDLNTLAQKLRKNEFEVEIFPRSEPATNYIMTRCSKKTVGLGDSYSLWQIGLLERLKKTNDAEWVGDKKDRDTRKKAMTANVFILSGNAIAYDTGEIINIDSKGNRISGGLYYPDEIIYVLGKNKIAPNLEEAIKRAKNIAAPKNSQSHGYRTACAELGYCVNCSNSDRICRITCILHKKPKYANITVVLINQELGF